MTADLKKVVLIGSGGVGAVMALAFQSSGKAHVTMVVRSDYETVTTTGYEFDSVDYGHVKNWKPDHVAKSVEDAVAYGPFDYIVVSTKFTPEVQLTADLVRPLVHDGASVVLVQNGVGNEPPVAEAFPKAYVIGGVSMIGSTNYNAKVKHPTSDEVTFGTLDTRPEAIKATKELVEIYDASKSKGIFTDNLLKARWKKLVYNSAFNTISALTQTDTGRLYFAGLYETMVRPAMVEVTAIAEAVLGEPLPEGIIDFMLYSDNGIFYSPSMMVDVEKDQVMELEAILGNPLRYAKQHNVETPVLKNVYLLLRVVQYRLLEKKGLIKTPASFDREDTPPYFKTVPWEE